MRQFDVVGGFDEVNEFRWERRRGRFVAAAVAGVAALAVAGIGLGSSASADDPDPIAARSVLAVETLENLRAVEVETGTPADRTPPLSVEDAAAFGLPDPPPLDVRVALYRSSYRGELTELAALVGERVEVEPQLLLDAWTAAGDDRMLAVLSALGQLGDPYLWGAEGDESFDCSGLTRFAWAASGLELPHWSLAQANSGEPVDPLAIKPGDLVHRPGHIMLALGVGDTIIQSTNGEINGVQLGRWGAADAFTDPLTPRTVRWRVVDPLVAPAAEPVAEIPIAPVDTEVTPATDAPAATNAPAATDTPVATEVVTPAGDAQP